jgi:DNA-binding winged helix-turn-helix (wHTH) protein
MKDPVQERIEREISEHDAVLFTDGAPASTPCPFPGAVQASRHIGVESATEAALDFGRFRVLLRQRQLLADGLPVALGTRAFELLLALLEAGGSLVTKQQLLARVWPGIAVAEENVKVHVLALRKALGEGRGFIHTEFGRGYRFTAAVRFKGCGHAQRSGTARLPEGSAALCKRRVRGRLLNRPRSLYLVGQLVWR